MNCEEIAKLMDGYLDGELDALTSQKIEQHLRECHKCEEGFEADMALAHAITQSAPYYKATAELRQRIQSSLRDAVGAKDNCGSGQPVAVVPRPQGGGVSSFSGAMELAGFGSRDNFRRSHR